MDTLKVCGRVEVPDFEGRGFTHMISIGDPGDDFDGLKLSGIAEANYLALQFTDVHNPDDPDAPSVERLTPLFAWLDRQNGIERLLVHCMAGLGRSPSVALLVLCALEPAVPPGRHLMRVAEAAESSWIIPNLLVARFGEILLARKGEIYPVVKAWRTAQE